MKNVYSNNSNSNSNSATSSDGVHCTNTPDEVNNSVVEVGNMRPVKICDMSKGHRPPHIGNGEEEESNSAKFNSNINNYKSNSNSAKFNINVNNFNSAECNNKFNASDLVHG